MPIAPDVDWQTHVVYTLMENWPLGLAMLGMFYAFTKWVLPNVFLKSLRNGGGTEIGNIVDKKLKEQDGRIDSKIAIAFSKHEEVEELKMKLALQSAKDDAHNYADSIKGKLDDHDKRLGRIEDVIRNRPEV